jgi:uncharacterized damage-inducible protein DinB
MTTPNPSPTREVADLLETLAKHRGFLRQTIEAMSDEQIRTRSTVSALTLGGILKHVTAMEHTWCTFMTEGAAAFADATPERFMAQWQLDDAETGASLLAAHEAVAARTDAVIASADLDADHLLPEAPWFPAGASWSVRRVALHLIAETAQHAGHADIIREAIDGAKTMG